MVLNLVNFFKGIAFEIFFDTGFNSIVLMLNLPV